MANWNGPHEAQPLQCSTNATIWGESITVNFTKVRAQHIIELRNSINAEYSRRGLPTRTWADTITADVTNVRKAHVDELRTAIENLHAGDCGTDTYYCPGDTTGCFDGDGWETITADVTNIRAIHWVTMRNRVNDLETSCICETERCEFCSDCGYRYSVCRCQKGCYCDESKYSSGCTDTASGSDCGSINAGGTHPFKQYPGSVPHDDEIPYAMGTGPTGRDWSYYWSCKCSPFTW